MGFDQSGANPFAWEGMSSHPKRASVTLVNAGDKVRHDDGVKAVSQPCIRHCAITRKPSINELAVYTALTA